MVKESVALGRLYVSAEAVRGCSHAPSNVVMWVTEVDGGACADASHSAIVAKEGEKGEQCFGLVWRAC